MLRGGGVHPPGGGDGGFWSAVIANLGNSSVHSTTPELQSYGDWEFPQIPDGVPTVIIPVAFPVTDAPSTLNDLRGQIEVLAVFAAALLIWLLPSFFINKRFCCRCLRLWLSRYMRVYFCTVLLINVVMIGYVIYLVPHITANGLFFNAVKVVEGVAAALENVVTQLSIVAAAWVVFMFRKKLIMLLGFDSSVFRADLRDVLTCFQMSRFRTIEVSLWRADGLRTGIKGRSIFARLILGYNEPQHSRPHDGITSSVMLRECCHLNYDPEDDTQQLTIVFKAQEVVGQAMASLAPAAGAMLGGITNMASPLGPGPGAAVGAVAGIGAANSIGQEVARIDLSSAMINRLRAAAGSEGQTDRASASKTRPTMNWSEDSFTKVDLMPQGVLWLRIADMNA